MPFKVLPQGVESFRKRQKDVDEVSQYDDCLLHESIILSGPTDKFQKVQDMDLVLPYFPSATVDISQRISKIVTSMGSY